jgi:transcriptional regulator with XRE-family HTH domain
MISEQRHVLGAFLRARREALEPPRHASSARRRRTPGLRREEVAEASGLSTTWYTWIEQGRDVSLSASALARLADALHLSRAERAYLFELTRKRDPSPPSASVAVAPELSDLLQMTSAPAYLLDRLWRIQAWNAAARHLLAPWIDSGEACLLRYVFLDASARAFISDWETRARRLLAEFRADTAALRDDAEIRALVDDLSERSPVFRAFWTSHAVLAREGGARLFNHPQDGLLRYEQVTLIPPAHPDIKVVMLLPRKG